MKNNILVCGLNGCGKSTFGKALARKLGVAFRDIEDYYFPNRLPGEAYNDARGKEEAADALSADLSNPRGIVLAAVRADLSKEIERSFSTAIYIYAPNEIRLTRVRERSLREFGERALEGGDLYEQEQAFYRVAEKRTDRLVEEWLSKLDIPVIRIDGMRPIDENVDYVLGLLA